VDIDVLRGNAKVTASLLLCSQHKPKLSSQHRNNIELKFREKCLMLLTPIVKRLFFSCTLDMLLAESVDAKATTSFTFQEKESSSRP